MAFTMLIYGGYCLTGEQTEEGYELQARGPEDVVHVSSVAESNNGRFMGISHEILGWIEFTV